MPQNSPLPHAFSMLHTASAVLHVPQARFIFFFRIPHSCTTVTHRYHPF